jgi:hypothetical protein
LRPPRSEPRPDDREGRGCVSSSDRIIRRTAQPYADPAAQGNRTDSATQPIARVAAGLRNYQPFIADGRNSPLTAIVFDLRGIAFAAWTLTGFAIGALAGMLIRRVVPAIVATLAAYAGLALAAGRAAGVCFRWVGA